ncbi:flagellar biosynthesis/type III secretory pathway protein [Lachnospiraceae bacterium JC7]|nr:flagellar biosynthesis/type III secretory pathway protein [Lachnospiraceae bacterium JC7]
MYKGKASRAIIKGGRNASIQQFASTVEVFKKGEEVQEEVDTQETKPDREATFQDYRDMPLQRPDQLFQNGAIKSDEEISIMQRKMLRDAADRAEKIINIAKMEAEQIKTDAYEEGYNSGHQEGMQDGREAAKQQAEAEFKQTVEKYQTAVAHSIIQIGEERDESFHRYLDELKNVAIAVAEKVIHISLETSGEIIKRMIIAEVEKMKRTEWIKIYIDKFDYEQLISVDEDVAADLARISDNVKFVVQDKEKVGYAVIETPSEMIDIGVDSQIDNIRENLNGVSLGDDVEEGIE